MLCANLSNTSKGVNSTNYDKNPIKVYIKHFVQCLAYSFEYYHSLLLNNSKILMLAGTFKLFNYPVQWLSGYTSKINSAILTWELIKKTPIWHSISPDPFNQIHVWAQHLCFNSTLDDGDDHFGTILAKFLNLTYEEIQIWRQTVPKTIMETIYLGSIMPVTLMDTLKVFISGPYNSPTRSQLIQ